MSYELLHTSRPPAELCAVQLQGDRQMGIGGAVLYSVAYMAIFVVAKLGTFLMPLLRQVGSAFLDGAALYGASVGGGQWFHDTVSSDSPPLKSR